MAYNTYYPNFNIQQPMGINNQFYGQSMQPMQPQMNRGAQAEQFIQPQPIYKQSICLQGKSVDNIEVVKAMDIPLDGTVSYFPITDGSAIVTKQLQQDGTSKTIIYKPVEETESEEKPKYITIEELNKQINVITENNNTLKNGMNNIEGQIQELSNNFKNLLSEIKNFKGGKK